MAAQQRTANRETARHVPSVKAALAIAEVLGTSVEEVFGEPDSAENHVAALGTTPTGDVPVVAVRVARPPALTAPAGWSVCSTT